LAVTHIPYWDPICHDRDHEGIIDLLPLEHVYPLDQISEYIDAVDGEAASVCHDSGVVMPVELRVDVNSQVSYGFFGRFHGLDPKGQVDIA